MSASRDSQKIKKQVSQSYLTVLSCVRIEKWVETSHNNKKKKNNKNQPNDDEKLHIDYVKCVYGVAPQCPCFDLLRAREKKKEALTQCSGNSNALFCFAFILFAFGLSVLCCTHISGPFFFFFFFSIVHFHLCGSWTRFNSILIAYSSFSLSHSLLLFTPGSATNNFKCWLHFQEINHFRKQVPSTFTR